MRHLATTLLALLLATPLTAQERRPKLSLRSSVAVHSAMPVVDARFNTVEEVSFMKWFVGGGAALGALFTTAACHGTYGEAEEEKEKPGICGRSAAGSAFNGALLGALTGFLAHITLEKRASVPFSPGVDSPTDLVTFRIPVVLGR